MTSSSRARTRAVVAIALALVAYAAIVIRDFRGPIGDHVESYLYEYLSYYVSRNLTFTPLPRLDLINDQALYPFGTNVALQSFCVERDLYFSLVSRLFGQGPWLQLYYLGGLTLASYGTWALLRGRHGDLRAALVAIGAVLWNFYGAQKYPYHFNIACVHWTTLAIVTDFVIAERLVHRERVSLALVLLRAALVVLGFGLELGHVVGYGLTSLLAVALFAVALAIARRREPESDLARFTAGLHEEVRTRRRLLFALTATIALAAILYGSLVAQIVLATRAYDFSGVEQGAWWSHPARALLPYFPWFHGSEQPRFLSVYGDRAEEGIGSGGAGWLLLILAVAGLVRARHRARFVPLVVVLALYVVSRPTFDLVRWMPWFAFTRVFSRATVVYSTILALMALGLERGRVGPRSRAIGIAALGALAVLELATLARIKRAHAAFAFDDAFTAHMKRIEALPGEAVLDFPFCISGGNGDIGDLCPYPNQLKGVYALQRFHHKKVIGQYLGRLHPSQTAPFVEQGWPTLWAPDAIDVKERSGQTRCLDAEEWAFFTEFFERNDFAGIQLAEDRLPPGCPEQFYERFGRPMGVVTVPRAGRLAFVPRRPETRAEVSPERAKEVRLFKVLGSAPDEIVSHVPARGARVTSGLSAYEWFIRPDGRTAGWRWAHAPAAELELATDEPRVLRVDARYRTPIAEQVIDVSLDGVRVAEWHGGGDRPEPFEQAVGVALAPGRHVLRLGFARGNGPPPSGVPFAPTDKRPLAVMFESLVLRAVPPND